MTGQTLTRARNPYPIPASLERRPLANFRRRVNELCGICLRYIERHGERANKVAIVVTIAMLAIEVLAQAAIAWSNK